MTISIVSLLGVEWGSIAWVTIIVGIRIWISRTRTSRRRLALSDYMALITLVVSIVNGVPITLLSLLEKKGEDHAMDPYSRMLPILALSPEDMTLYMKYGVGSGAVYYLIVWLIKWTLCALYLEVVSHMTKTLKMWCWLTAGCTVATFIGAFLSLLLTCRPLSRTWETPVSPTYCPIYNETALIVQFVMTLSADIGLMAFPIVMIRKLNLAKSEVKATSIVFVMGAVSISSAIIRFGFLYSIIVAVGEDALSKSVEGARMGEFWAIIEYASGLTAACLPAFRVFLRSGRRPTSGQIVGDVSDTSLGSSENQGMGALQDVSGLARGDEVEKGSFR